MPKPQNQQGVNSGVPIPVAQASTDPYLGLGKYKQWILGVAGGGVILMEYLKNSKARERPGL
jgi:hypothetical protein